MKCGAKLFDAPLGAKPVLTLLGSVQTTTLVVVMIFVSTPFLRALYNANTV